MAGTATNFDPTVISAGTNGQLWANLAIPSAGARLTLHTDGTPDATANPNAIHLGMTRAGATITAKPTYEGFMADEFPQAVKTKMSALETTITAELLQVEDWDILKLLTAGFGTYAAGSGYEEVSFGIGTQSYSSIALIFPTEADSTKFGVFHLYKAFNESGLDAIEKARKTMAGAKVVFKGVDITSRAVTDTAGKWWKQIA